MSTSELSKKTAAASLDNARCSSYERNEKLIYVKKCLPSEPKVYEIGCKIGAGSFGLSVLHLAKLADSNEANLYVVKKLRADRLSAKELQNIQTEIQLSSRFNHPFILPSYSSFVVENDVIWTVLPLFNFGSCRDIISTEFHHGLPLLLVAIVLRSVILALEYLHKAGYIHRAVNASHILLHSDNRACLSGLRHCLQMPRDNVMAHDYPDDTVTVLPWIAPEILMQNVAGYNDRSDIYSLGITAVELVTGTIPYSKLRPTEILVQKHRGVVPQLPDKATLEELHCDLSASQSSLDGLEQTNDMTFSPGMTTVPSKKVRNLHQFVDSCLQSDMTLRPSAFQLRYCSYIRSVKRRIKEKDCPTFKELLSPLTPILELSHDNRDITPDVEVEIDSGTTLCNDGWTF